MRKRDKELFEELNNKIINYTNTSKKNFYDFEIIHPSVNMLVNCAYSALATDNGYSAFMSIRGMLEAVAAIAFFEYKDPDCDFFNKYLEYGRIDFDKNNRRDTSINFQIGCIDKILSNDGTQDFYDKLCRFVHFGKDQLKLIIENVSYEDGGKTSFSCRISISALDSKSKDLIRDMVRGISQIACEVLDYYRKHRHMNNHRSSYVVYGESDKLLPK